MSLFEQISTRVSLTDIDCVNTGRGMGVDIGAMLYESYRVVAIPHEGASP